MALADDPRRDARPTWIRLASSVGMVLVPIVVPLLLFGGVFAYSMSRDAEPGGMGEPSTGLVPGAVTVTGWHRFDRSFVPEGFRQQDPGHASPQALVDAMVAAARKAAGAEPWIAGTLVSEDGDEAKARVYLPASELSQAFVAVEQLLELTVKADGWYVRDADARFHCRRAVRDGFCG